jgi:uncharacterized membrane protein YjjP (DUF1212 family)
MNVLPASTPDNADAPHKPGREVIQVLTAATRALFIDGETTRRLVLAVERLGHALGVDVVVSARWGEVTLRFSDPAAPRLEWIDVTPLGVDMHKVAEANDLIDKVCANAIGVEEESGFRSARIGGKALQQLLLNVLGKVAVSPSPR